MCIATEPQVSARSCPQLSAARARVGWGTSRATLSVPAGKLPAAKTRARYAAVAGRDARFRVGQRRRRLQGAHQEERPR